MLKMQWHKLTGFGLGVFLAVGAPAAVFAHDADETFRKFDANSDGKISAAEHEAGAQKRFRKWTPTPTERSPRRR